MTSIGTFLLSLPWFVPVVIYIVVAYVGVRWLGKHLANQPDQIKRLTVNNAFTATAGILFAIATDSLRFDTATFVIMGVGVLNAFANITQWRANRASMSKTSLLSFGDDIIAVLLAILIVGDGQYLNPVTAMGMLVCFFTGILFWWHDRKKAGGTSESSNFYMLVLAYSVLWGVADFSVRYFAFNALPVWQFVFAWYLGTFLTMLVVFLGRKLLGFTGDQSGKSFKLKDYAVVFAFAMGIAGCLAIEYWARILAPQTVVGPIFLVAEAIVPTFIGLWIFKEKSKFDKTQWGLVGLGIVGVIMLGIGFHGV